MSVWKHPNYVVEVDKCGEDLHISPKLQFDGYAVLQTGTVVPERMLKQFLEDVNNACGDLRH